MEFLIWKYVLIISLWIGYLWEQYLCYRQYELAYHCTRRPQRRQNVMRQRLFSDTRRYIVERKRLGFVKDFISIMTSTIVIVYDVLPMVWDAIGTNYQLSEANHSMLWCLVLTISWSVIKLPLTIYEFFVIEWQRLENLVWEKAIFFAGDQMMVLVIYSSLVDVIEKSDNFLMGVWLAISTLVFLIGIYPSIAPAKYLSLGPLERRELRTEIYDLALQAFLVGVINPMTARRFDSNIAPLNQVQLRREIGNLAEQLHFPLSEIYLERNFESDSLSDPLYIYGTVKTKSIVVNHFLWTRGCTAQDILALVAYEIAGWHHKHVFKYIVLLELRLFLSFVAFFFLFRNPEIYKIFGFLETQPVFVGAYVVLQYVMPIYGTLLCFCSNYISQNFVKECDEFVVKLDRGDDLAMALLKLDNHFDSFFHDHLYSLWHHYKPALPARVQTINKFMRNWERQEGYMEEQEGGMGYVLLEPE